MVGSVALWSGEAVLGSRSFDTQQEAVRRLPASVQELLAEAGTASVQGLVVSRGPGSFNGLRVGVALAKALAHAWRVPIAGLSTPLVWAAETAPRFPGHPVAVVQPSRRGHVYLTIVAGGPWQVKSGGEGPPPILRGPEVVAIESLGPILRESPTPPVLTGEGADLAEWAAQQTAVLLDAERAISPSAATVAWLAGWALGKTAEDCYYTLRPEYVSPSQAERNWGVNLGL